MIFGSNQKLLMARSGAIPPDRSWDIGFATYNGESFNFSTQEIIARGIFFKPDGLKLYVIGQSGRDVNEYTLSTAWSVPTASYVQNFSVSSQELEPTGLFFKPDGTKMYIVGTSGDDVNEYTLSTAWSVSTASYVQNFSVSSIGTTPEGLFFRDDGTKMYVISYSLGSAGTQKIGEYDLSTGWDISTSSYLQDILLGQSVVPNPTDLFFKFDGTKMYALDRDFDRLHEYTLSTAWDVSTATRIKQISVRTQTGFPQGLSFKDDGSKLYISDSTVVYEYDIG